MENNIIEYLNSNIATSKEIQQRTGFSQKKVSRELQKLGDRIIKIANGRSPKYALTINAFGVSDKINIWKIDSFAKATCIAILRPLATRGFFIEKKIDMPQVFLGEAKNGLFEDLPYFLRDMTPQGFLGKQIAKKLNQIDENFPKNPNDWSNDNIGKYLLANSDNAMGNLQFGDSTNLKLRNNFIETFDKDYPAIANDIIDGENIMSSIGGEQQKFTTYSAEKNMHVLVKFSPQGKNKNARRWKDILLTEYHANKVLTDKTTFITTPDVYLLELDARIFLVSKRFDREGKFGRKSMFSLKMIDAEFAGSGDDWVKTAKKLSKDFLISDQDLSNINILWIFGKLINNADMHLGNLSFAEHNETFNLLPIYDMCSMGFAPRSNGEITPLTFDENLLDIDKFDKKYVDIAKKLADYFWQSLLEEPKISVEFKTFITKFLNDRKIERQQILDL